MMITTIDVRGQQYPAVAASQLQNGMIYHDGSEIVNVSHSGRMTTLTLFFDGGSVDRKVQSQSLIALSHEQVAVVL